MITPYAMSNKDELLDEINADTPIEYEPSKSQALYILGLLGIVVFLAGMVIGSALHDNLFHVIEGNHNGISKVQKR
jgi:hypothetical protein